MGETIINGIIEASQEVAGQLQYARGAKGDTGDSGVYIGTTPPTDPNIKVWIDTSEESGDVEMTSNKVTSISSESTDTQYPSAKAVAEAIDPRTVYQKFIDDNKLKQRNWVDLSFVGGEYYYTDFLQAVADVNADTTVNSTTNSTNAVCQIFKNKDITVLRLLSDIAVTTEVVFEKSVIFDINGFTVSLTNNAVFGEQPENMSDYPVLIRECTLVFYGAKTESKITGTDCLFLINCVQKDIYILGGKYEATYSQDYSLQGGYIISARFKHSVDRTIEIYNTNMYSDFVSNSNIKGLFGFFSNAADTNNHRLKVCNSKIYIYTPTCASQSITSLVNSTIVEPKNTNVQLECKQCKFINISPANKGDSASRCIRIACKNAKIEDCYIEGMTSGIANLGNLLLKNCVCKSPAHGGIYNATGGIATLINCEFHRNPTTEGYTPTGTAAAYFGYGSIAYIDGCSFILDIDGDTSDGIAIKQGDGTIPTKVFISNSEIPKLRCDSGQYVYLGEGISDTIRNTTVGGTKVLNEENYSTYINKEMSQPIVDIEYEPTSRSPQSGIAVKKAVTEAKDYTNTKIGDIDTALDNIIALQNSYIGGNP